MTEKRQSPRMRRLKEARVFFLDGRTVITCKVRDVKGEEVGIRSRPESAIPEFGA